MSHRITFDAGPLRELIIIAELSKNVSEPTPLTEFFNGRRWFLIEILVRELAYADFGLAAN